MEYVFTPPPQAAIPVVGSQQFFPVHRVYLVGRNYVEHAKEMGHTGREAPFFFLKPADALVVVPDGATGDMPYPPLTSDLHHEIELVVAIGKGGSDIAAADANAHIWGYAIGLDMTRRDLQGEAKKQGRPWDTGKGFEHSAPIGPIHPIAQTGLIESGSISLEVNGARRQSGDINQLIWKVPEIIEHLSRYFVLQPGDLIYTGTPAGVGAVQKGDLLEGTVDKLGSLRVKVA
ncbi:fumarylacetoacetate hydrolase family protein [Noviherbaspirillum pedocola]|uniref:Fumarylacetoacetate hydrolase family protein n=1 Tax=Noviherbaspirillum pedocola TaxID=2801341 RepID=A0A934T362_9BURK|nr:fumarylacetoacetate hydrolase family protein [Noviherbaspirillum pedocola]MBK4737468.1 fumarylacetoacetate hydrolase family protein [Noviherbaspirillum pedocola]